MGRELVLFVSRELSVNDDWGQTEQNWATTTTGEWGDRFHYRKCSVHGVFIVDKMV